MLFGAYTKHKCYKYTRLIIAMEIINSDPIFRFHSRTEYLSSRSISRILSSWISVSNVCDIIILITIHVTLCTDNISLYLRISNKYGSLTRNKFHMKSATTLKQHNVYSKYALLSRFQIDVSDWLKFSLIEELTYEIDA
jgi:hypothetical protein